MSDKSQTSKPDYEELSNQAATSLLSYLAVIEDPRGRQGSLLPISLTVIIILRLVRLKIYLLRSNLTSQSIVTYRNVIVRNSDTRFVHSDNCDSPISDAPVLAKGAFFGGTTGWLDSAARIYVFITMRGGLYDPDGNTTA